MQSHYSYIRTYVCMYVHSYIHASSSYHFHLRMLITIFLNLRGKIMNKYLFVILKYLKNLLITVIEPDTSYCI